MRTPVAFHDITPFSKTHFLLAAVTDIATMKYSADLKASNNKRISKGQAPIKEWKPEWSICVDGTFQALVPIQAVLSFLREIWNAIPKSLQPHFRIGSIQCPDYPTGKYIFIGPTISCADVDKLLLDAPDYQHNQAVLDYIKDFFPNIKPSRNIDPALTYKVFSTPESNRMYCYYIPGWFADNCSQFSLPINPDDYNSFKAEYQRPDRVKSLPPPVEIRKVPPVDDGADLPESHSNGSLAEATGEEAASEASPKAATPALAAPIPATTTLATANGTTTTVAPMLNAAIPSMFNDVLGFAMNLTKSVGDSMLSVHDAMVGTLIAVADTVTTTLATSSTTASEPTAEEDGFMMAAPDRSTLRGLTRADIEHALTYEMQEIRSENPEKPITPPDSPQLH